MARHGTRFIHASHWIVNRHAHHRAATAAHPPERRPSSRRFCWCASRSTSPIPAQVRLPFPASGEPPAGPHRNIDRYSGLDALVGGRDVDSEVGAGLGNAGELSAVDLDSGQASLVLGRLLLNRGPSAVFRTVVTVWVDSIDAVPPSRPRPHVFEESLERLFPTFADLDTATAPVREVLVLLVVAPAFHA